MALLQAFLATSITSYCVPSGCIAVNKSWVWRKLDSCGRRSI